MTTVPKSSRDSRDLPITIATLREIGLFGALSDEVLAHLADMLKTVRVGVGDEVFREGDSHGREMYVVLEGEIEVTKRSRRGRDMRVAILGPTDTFGEMSLVDMQARSACASHRSDAPDSRDERGHGRALSLRSEIVRPHRAEHRAGLVATTARGGRHPRRFHREHPRRVRYRIEGVTDLAGSVLGRSERPVEESVFGTVCESVSALRIS